MQKEKKKFRWHLKLYFIGLFTFNSLWKIFAPIYWFIRSDILPSIDIEYFIAFDVLLIFILFYNNKMFTQFYISKLNLYNFEIKNFYIWTNSFILTYLNNFLYFKKLNKNLYYSPYFIFFLEKYKLFFFNKFILLNNSKFYINFLNSYKLFELNILNNLYKKYWNLIFLNKKCFFYLFSKKKKKNMNINLHSFLFNTNKFLLKKWNVLLYKKWWLN